MSRSFIERSVQDLLRTADHAVFAEETARVPGLLQGLDARVKLAGFLALIVAATISHRLLVVVALFVLALALLAASRITSLGLFLRVWAIAFGFTTAIALPALFLTPGETIASIGGLEVTRQGLRTAAFLITRVETAATFSLLLVVTTRWASLLAALRSFGVPSVFVVVLGMAYRYLFVLLLTASELFDGRRSRRVGPLTGRAQRQLATTTAGAMLSKSVQLSDEIYLAMQARGFRGEVRVLDQPSLRAADWTALTAFLLVAIVAGVAGR